MMKFIGVFLLVVFSAAVIRVQGGQQRVACILIPAYDPGEFAEGENEEEEIKGWGPGTHNTAAGSQHTIVTYTQEGDGSNGPGSEGPPPTSRVSGQGSVSVAAPGGRGQGGGSGRNPMTDPSKPPGPNPKWGYWEWDTESGRWETEDFRRRRRQAPGSVLKGRLQCGPGTVIHVDKVTLGFSIDNRCSPVRPVCQATSTLGRQVAHCEGQAGACGVTVSQKFLYQCGRRTNYARIQYECITVAERHNICDAKTFTSTGSLVLSSPTYSRSVGKGAHAQYLSCECEVTRDGSTALAVPWGRTQLDTGSEGVCGDEMILLDTWDSSANRFALQNELCGLQSLRDKTFSTSVLKITYIPSFVHVATNGFLFKIQGQPDPRANLQVTCSVVSADAGPAPGAQAPPLSARPSSETTEKPTERKLPRLPVNFDLKKYPGLLNKTLAAYRNRLLQEGSASSQVGDTSGASPGGYIQHGGGDLVPASSDQFDVKGTSGTLSAVVASLSSIILVMGSLGVFLAYRRYQKKKKQNDVYFDSRSTVRSDAALYSEPTYQDPTGPGSGIPASPHHVTSLPSSSSLPPSDPVTNIEAARRDDQNPGAAETRRTPDPVQRKAAPRKASCDGELPALPRRPPRPKKNKMKTRRLPEEEEEDVVYDNNADCSLAVRDGVVTLMGRQDEDYASLGDLTTALGGTSTGKERVVSVTDPGSEEEEEIVTAEVQTDN